MTTKANKVTSVADRLGKMTDDELFDELRMIVNVARNNTTYDRDLAQAIGAECHRRGWLKHPPKDAL
jgi:hypothetical protein